MVVWWATLVVCLCSCCDCSVAAADSGTKECTIQADGSEKCTEPTASSCTDVLGTDKCQSLAARDGCIESFATMRHSCAETCGLCDTLDVAALQHEPAQKYSLKRLYSAEFPQIIEGNRRVETYRHLQDVDQYMYETVYHDDEFAAVRTQCQNRHELCTFWAMRKLYYHVVQQTYKERTRAAKTASLSLHATHFFVLFLIIFHFLPGRLV